MPKKLRTLVVPQTVAKYMKEARVEIISACWVCQTISSGGVHILHNYEKDV